ncbi:MAG: nucleotide sugar dehydrogenase [Clostridiales bacterium]|jgi:UDPglucose 6-dehydrogenase|nr:nucleotide sugar dehydrogenase [Clostridiales bacterium]
MRGVSVFGLGFVGLTTALGFADKGFAVRGYDVDKERVETIAAGRLPFIEPGLDDALKRCLGRTFTLADSPAAAVEESDAVFFCVGTPCGENGRADLTYLFSALDAARPALADGRFRALTVKSTVPPGTTSGEVIPHTSGWAGDFAVANNPEFLREGKCWEDFTQPDRIVVGAEDLRAAALLRELYEPFGAPVHLVSLNTGEYIKYLSNTLLANLISWSNEMALMADALGGVEVGPAFRILHEDKRLRGSGIRTYIYPGCGYGGYCLPKDTRALAARAAASGFEPRILREVIAANDGMPAAAAEKIQKILPKGKPLGVLGLSFKPESDDVRDSPAAKIIGELVKRGYSEFFAYDPVANGVFDAVYKLAGVTYCDTAEEVIEKCDTIAVVTTWAEFAGLSERWPGKRWADCRYFLK